MERVGQERPLLTAQQLAESLGVERSFIYELAKGLPVAKR
jgi:hypothetical protein